MKVISESYLREIFRKAIPVTFKLEGGQVLTPSASRLLGEKGGKVIGGREEEPEHMTELAGNRLLPRDHQRIVFRGRLETCRSELLLLQVRADDAGKKEMVSDLSEILERTEDILRRDVDDIPVPEKPILGLSEAELRARSLDPEKYYGIGNLVPTFEMGELILGLNLLRALVRELEVSAVGSLQETYQPARNDIAAALNRMSDALYIMMLKEKGGIYK